MLTALSYFQAKNTPIDPTSQIAKPTPKKGPNLLQQRQRYFACCPGRGSVVGARRVSPQQLPGTTAEPRKHSRRNGAASAPHDQRSIRCSSCAGCKSSDDTGKSPCTCASSICRKRIHSVDRELCACCGRYSRIRSGAPTKMLTIMRNFHEGMRAFVSTDERARTLGMVCDVTQRGCGKAACYHRSLLLFNVFFAAALHVVLVRFGE